MVSLIHVTIRCLLAVQSLRSSESSNTKILCPFIVASSIEKGLRDNCTMIITSCQIIERSFVGLSLLL